MTTLPDQSASQMFYEFMASWPTGVTVLTTQADGRPLGCTAQSLMSVSLEPPQLVASLARTSNTLAGLLQSGFFGLSILHARQAELARRFSAGPAQERFRDTPVKVVLGVPILVGAAAAMVCRLGETWPQADHFLVIGFPLWQEVDHDGDPLLRHRSRYRALG
jgi:flavin reductase (DIM6/NTAB) family NADH-FMN oxidoreductase RutF